jgi:colanic acid/amylovoran biosynthesis glycosyltransferase
LELRLAVFNNRFPGFVSTFFARDMRGLLDAGVDVDVFAIHPLEPELWHYVPDMLNEQHLPREKVHHTSLARTIRYAKPWPLVKVGTFLQDVTAISASAAKFGIRPLAKTVYVLLKGWTWAQAHPANYDHILAYWGNYSATCAYVYDRLASPRTPFSIFLHAGMDLYRTPIYMRQKLLYAENIITCSEFNRRFIYDHFSDISPLISDKIYVHHHGLDFREFLYEPDDRPARKIIGVGRLERPKGFNYLLLAAHELSQRGIKIEVELIGDGKETDALRALADTLRITDNVRFRGWLTPDEARIAMRQATALVHPSPDLGDGMPNVIKEAMALGTPVIASNVAGIPELLDSGGCGILVPPKDVKALADAIETLLANKAMRRKFADAARQHAEKKFDLWQNGQRLANLLSSTTRLEHMRLYG